MQEYIHYGDPFDINRFNHIQNEPGFTKPRGGLWASRVDAKWGWKDWCKVEKFRDCTESSTFTLEKNTRILTIKDKEELENLPRTNRGVINITMLDFEQLAQKYDAIEVLISEDRRLYWRLYGWDCDSILVMNAECIKLKEDLRP